MTGKGGFWIVSARGDARPLSRLERGCGEFPESFVELGQDFG